MTWLGACVAYGLGSSRRAGGTVVGRRVVVEGSLTVGRPPREALPLFTPEGERRWVTGWEPVYPDSGDTDRTEPGTVFVTRSDVGTTTWIVLDRDEDRMRYGRVTAGRSAGTVTVTCRDGSAAGTSEVIVAYDLTALSDDGEGDVAALSDDYAGYLAGWAARIADLDR